MSDEAVSTKGQMRQMAEAEGVHTDHAERAFAAGVSPGLVEEAKQKGLSFPNLIALFMQYGPTFVAILQDILSRIKQAPLVEGKKQG